MLGGGKRLARIDTSAICRRGLRVLGLTVCPLMIEVRRANDVRPLPGVDSGRIAWCCLQEPWERPHLTEPRAMVFVTHEIANIFPKVIP